jgi:ribosomal protein S18 acetylase RimI-like enzyme
MLEIRPLEEKEAARGAALLARAFAESPVYVAVLSEFTAATRLTALQRIKHGFLKAAAHHGACRTAYVDGALAGVSLVLPPGGYPFSIRDELRQSLGCATTGPTAITRFLRISGYLRKRHLAEPHFYLYAIGVEPSHQGRGIGKALLAELHRRADEAGMPCFLETEKAINVRLYESTGYIVKTKDDLPGFTDLPMWTMVRPRRGEEPLPLSPSPSGEGERRRR